MLRGKRSLIASANDNSNSNNNNEENECGLVTSEGAGSADLHALSFLSRHFDQELIKEMTALNLSHHNLLRLPPDIRRFEALRGLDLSNNHIQFIDAPLLIRYCPHLRTLNLSHNFIEDLREIQTLGLLKHLEILDIRNNPLPLIDNRPYLLQALLFVKIIKKNDEKNTTTTTTRNALKKGSSMSALPTPSSKNSFRTVDLRVMMQRSQSSNLLPVQATSSLSALPPGTPATSVGAHKHKLVTTGSRMSLLQETLRSASPQTNSVRNLLNTKVDNSPNSSRPRSSASSRADETANLAQVAATKSLLQRLASTNSMASNTSDTNNNNNNDQRPASSRKGAKSNDANQSTSAPLFNTQKLEESKMAQFLENYHPLDLSPFLKRLDTLSPPPPVSGRAHHRSSTPDRAVGGNAARSSSSPVVSRAASSKSLYSTEEILSRMATCPVPRDNTNFPMLWELNGEKITVEEYQLAENEEIFDSCTFLGKKSDLPAGGTSSISGDRDEPDDDDDDYSSDDDEDSNEDADGDDDDDDDGDAVFRLTEYADEALDDSRSSTPQQMQMRNQRARSASPATIRGVKHSMSNSSLSLQERQQRPKSSHPHLQTTGKRQDGIPDYDDEEDEHEVDSSSDDDEDDAGLCVDPATLQRDIQLENMISELRKQKPELKIKTLRSTLRELRKAAAEKGRGKKAGGLQDDVACSQETLAWITDVCNSSSGTEYVSFEDYKNLPQHRMKITKGAPEANVSFWNVMQREFAQQKKQTNRILQSFNHLQHQLQQQEAGRKGSSAGTGHPAISYSDLTGAVDFRPLKNQFLEMSIEEIELRMKRMELKEKIEDATAKCNSTAKSKSNNNVRANTERHHSKNHPLYSSSSSSSSSSKRSAAMLLSTTSTSSSPKKDNINNNGNDTAAASGGSAISSKYKTKLGTKQDLYDMFEIPNMKIEAPSSGRRASSGGSRPVSRAESSKSPTTSKNKYSAAAAAAVANTHTTVTIGGETFSYSDVFKE